MRSFLLLLLIGLLGGGAYLYQQTTEEYERERRLAEQDFQLREGKLTERKKELEGIIEKGNHVFDGAMEEQTPVNPASPGAVSEDIAELQAVIKDKSGLVKKKDELEKYLENTIERQKNYVLRGEKLIEKNFKTMEKSRNDAYNKFEARQAADNSSMTIKGPRYAREKRELDALATNNQNKVNQENEQIRKKILESEKKLQTISKRIKNQIAKVDVLIKDPDFTPEKQQALAREIGQIVKDSSALEDENDGARTVIEFELDSYHKKLAIAQNELEQISGEKKEAVNNIQKDYDAKMFDLKTYGGTAAAVLALLLFVSFIYNRAQG